MRARARSSHQSNLPIHSGLNLQLIADVFNVYNKRTGYNPQPSLNSALFGVPQNAFDPRTFQLQAKVQS